MCSIYLDVCICVCVCVCLSASIPGRCKCHGHSFCPVGKKPVWCEPEWIPVGTGSRTSWVVHRGTDPDDPNSARSQLDRPSLKMRECPTKLKPIISIQLLPSQAKKRATAEQQQRIFATSTTKDAPYINRQQFQREVKSRWQQINTNIIEKLTGPSKAADAVHFDADENRIGTLHAAVVGYHLQDVVVILLVVERLRIADYAYKSACNNKINKQTKKSRDYLLFFRGPRTFSYLLNH